MCTCPRKDNTELSRWATAVKNTAHSPDQLYNEQREKPSKSSSQADVTWTCPKCNFPSTPTLKSRYQSLCPTEPRSQTLARQSPGTSPLMPLPAQARCPVGALQFSRIPQWRKGRFPVLRLVCTLCSQNSTQTVRFLCRTFIQIRLWEAKWRNRSDKISKIKSPFYFSSFESTLSLALYFISSKTAWCLMGLRKKK